MSNEQPKQRDASPPTPHESKASGQSSEAAQASSQVSTQAQQANYRCADCNKTFARRVFHRQHVRRHHPSDALLAIRAARGTRKAHACDQPGCRASFDNAKALKGHRERMHNPDSAYQRYKKDVPGGVPCPQCDHVSRSKIMAKEHRYYWHDGVAK